VTWMVGQHFFKSCQLCVDSNALDGADFEIVPTDKISSVSSLISFSPTCSPLLPWQASSIGTVRSEAASEKKKVRKISGPKLIQINELIKTARNYYEILKT